MNITRTDDYIRQQQAGRFSRPEDGKGPFAHVNDQKLDSIKGQKERSVYVNNEKAVTWQKELTESDFPKLFDSDAGAKSNAKKIGEAKKEEKPLQQYDKTEKTQTGAKQERLVDQWA